MSDNASTFSESGTSAHGEGLRDDGPSASPSRPASGSALDALVQRQMHAPGFDRCLSFVPVQIR